MINILNLNPSIDYFIHVDDFELNKTNHSTYEEAFIGGKGSNVALMLDNLHVESKLFGFVGGFVGDHISKELEQFQFIDNNMIDTKMMTRINVKMHYQGETEINGVGRNIPQVYLDRLEHQIRDLTSEDILVMTGSVANGMSYEWYLKMAKEMHDHQIEFVLDVNNKIIEEVLKYKPLLLKPNEDEIKTIFDHQGKLTKSNLINYGRELLKKGAQHVIISLGKNGSMFFVDDKIYTSKNVKGKVLNTVGAGDSMIAGFLAEYHQTNDSLKAYKMAQASGNATAFTSKIADKNLIDEIYDKVEIEEIGNEN